MKNLFLAIILGLSSLSHAEAYGRKELTRMSLDNELSEENLIEEWNKFFDAQNLKTDRNKTRNDWKSLLPVARYKYHPVQGSRLYYGVAAKKYQYDVIEDPEKNLLIVALGIHLYPSKSFARTAGSEETMDRIKNEVKKAEEIWNLHAPKNVSFTFDVMGSAEEAHYSIKVTEEDRTIYDKVFSSSLNREQLVHEIGHMLGLDEEYAVVSTNILNFSAIKDKINKVQRDEVSQEIQRRKCNLQSFMCDDFTADTKIYPYHFDHILGRIPLD